MKNENKKYKQVELMPLTHGGKRANAGRKKIDDELKKPKTVVIRVDERLLTEVEKLKNGKEMIEISKIKELIIKAKKEHEQRYFKSTGEEKIKNYAMATAITHFDILFDNLVKQNS